MKDSKKIILHLMYDSIFFDSLSNEFDKMLGYKNIYLYTAYDNIKPFTFIKNKEKVIIAESIERWGNIICDPQIDIIYLHGLWNETMEAIKFIRKDVMVIWWCYGMEIYENKWRRAPLLPLRLYKKKTFWIWEKNLRKNHSLISGNLEYFFPKLYNYIIEKLDTKEHSENISKMIERVDYLFTPLPLEYELIKKSCKLIKAKHFHLHPYSSTHKELASQKYIGNILLDHSAVLSNNHFDIIHRLKKYNLSSRNIFIPISYGDQFIKEKLKQFKTISESKTIYIENPLPFPEYHEIIKTCSHAFFGGIRQTGLGNIYLCLRNGIKIFFFENSILYKFFKEKEYVVFSIDKDLSDDNLQNPLTPEEIAHNNEIYNKQFEPIHGTYQEQFDKLYSSWLTKG